MWWKKFNYSNIHLKLHSIFEIPKKYILHFFRYLWSSETHFWNVMDNCSNDSWWSFTTCLYIEQSQNQSNVQRILRSTENCSGILVVLHLRFIIYKKIQKNKSKFAIFFNKIKNGEFFILHLKYNVISTGGT